MSYNVNMKRFLPYVLILLVPFIYFSHIQYPTLIKDAADYHNYAANLVEGHGYNRSGSGFDNFREPGYPLFVAGVYEVSGVGNLTALIIAQSLLLGFLGILVYLLLRLHARGELALAAAVLVAGLPIYGVYTHIIGSELLFTFMVCLVFTLVIHMHEIPRGAKAWFILGLLAGATSLVRLQFIFFLPFVFLLAFLFARSHIRFKHAAISIFGLCLVIGSWVVTVHTHSGSYGLTGGRPGLVLHTRAARAKLSYADNTRYAIDWLKRSLSGGEGSDFLERNDYHYLQADYERLATSTQATMEVNKADRQTILSNFGHYLYGSIIEVAKLNYIEHDYSDSLNKYIRAFAQLLVYGLFLFGLYKAYKTPKGYAKTVSLVGLVFIVYNWLIVAPFDAIPRYNTPYLFLLLLVGFMGMATIWQKA